MDKPDNIEVRSFLSTIQKEQREKHVYQNTYDVLSELGFSDEVQLELAAYLSDVNSPHRRAVLAVIIDLECMPMAALDLAVEQHCLGFTELAFLSRMFLGLD